MDYPRLLVLANNSFSKSNSNGRTLGSLLRGWPKDRIAQFCISSEGADFTVCDNYYCVTDGDVLRSCLHLKPAKRRNLEDAGKIDSNSKDGHIKHRKTSLKMFARNLTWKSGLWKGSEFSNWLKEFKPEMVLLQSGDSYFMFDLAMDIAKKFNAKTAIFNTEGFYFFRRDFFAKDGKFGQQLFKLYQLTYRRHFCKFMRTTSKQIYGNELLRHDYDNAFGNSNSCVIYTASSLDFEFSQLKNKQPVFSYLGNLGFNRPEALVDFAEVLLSINPDFRLDVYGAARNRQMEEMLQAAPGIRFHGAVPYSYVIQIIRQSDFLVHAESQEEQFREALRYGFSTKIADSISSGKTLILFSSPNIACAKYIQDNGAGLFASTKDSLRRQICDMLNNPEKRMMIAEKAKLVAAENHNSQINIKKAFEYLTQ